MADELQLILDEVEEGMWEYCFSLEAYCCNEEPEEFIDREQKVLIELFIRFIN